MGRVLGDAAEDVGDAVGDARPLPSPERAQEERRSEFQFGDLSAFRGGKRGHGSQRKGGGDVLLVCEGADDGAEEHGGAEAGDEEAADVALVEAVLLVEVVHVGALQPVPGCEARTPPTIIRGQQFSDRKSVV